MDGHLDEGRQRVSVLLEPLELLLLQEEELRCPLAGGELRIRASATRLMPYVYRHAGGCDIILTQGACDELLHRRAVIIECLEYIAGIMTTLYPLETLK